MADVTVTASVDGTQATVDFLNGVVVRINLYAGNTVEAACRRIVARAQAVVPVRTGALKASIGYAMRGPTLGVVGLGPPGDKYWYLVEFGTKFAGAHPFMRPAAEPEHAQFTVEMSNAINRAVAEDATQAAAPAEGEGGLRERHRRTLWSCDLTMALTTITIRVAANTAGASRPPSPT